MQVYAEFWAFLLIHCNSIHSPRFFLPSLVFITRDKSFHFHIIFTHIILFINIKSRTKIFGKAHDIYLSKTGLISVVTSYRSHMTLPGQRGCSYFRIHALSLTLCLFLLSFLQKYSLCNNCTEIFKGKSTIITVEKLLLKLISSWLIPLKGANTLISYFSAQMQTKA